MTSLFIAPRVPMVEPSTGLANPVWYRFFADMFAAFAGGGGTGAILLPPGGGTGITNYTIGDLIFASSATTLDKLHNVATGNALISGGVGFVPTWGKIGLTTHVSGILPAPSGGSGFSSYDAGDLIYAASGTALAKLSIGTNNYVLTSDGTAPVWTQNTGTGNVVRSTSPTFSGTVTFNGSINTGATITTGNGVSTGATSIELGGNRTGDGSSLIDMHSTSGTDYEVRIIRTAGVNGDLNIFQTGTGALNILTGGSTRLSFTSAGAATFSVSLRSPVIGVGAAPSASGAGITFPATQSASTDPNTLDDYEEGTWTPTVTAGSGSFTTLGTISGHYTKIGRQVFCTVVINITTNGTAAGSISATLPFTASAAAAWAGAGREHAVTGKGLQASISSPGTVMMIYNYDGTYPGANGAVIVATVSYFV